MTIQEKTKLKLLNLKIELWINNMHANGKFSIFDASFAKELFRKKFKL